MFWRLIRLAFSVLLAITPIVNSAVSAFPIEQPAPSLETLTSLQLAVSTVSGQSNMTRLPTSDLPSRPFENQRPSSSVFRPDFRPLAAGIPQTITVQVVPNILFANSAATAIITATVVDLTGTPVSDVNLSGVISPTAYGTVSGLGLTNGLGQITGTWQAGTQIGLGTLEIGDGVVSGTASIELTSGAVTTLTVVPGFITLTVATTTTFGASGTDAFGNVVPITPTWTTTGGAIDSSGVFTAPITATSGIMITAFEGINFGSATANILAGPLNLIVITPSTASIIAGTVFTFTAAGFDVYSNSVPITPTWTTNGGTINSSGVFTAQNSAAAGKLVTATYDAISNAALVNIIAGPLNSIVITPSTASIAAGSAFTFTAAGFDVYSNSVPITPTWSTDGGTISQGGVFTAQNTIAAGKLVTVAQDVVVQAALVNIIAGPLNSIAITPSTASIVAGSVFTFTAAGFDVQGNGVPITPTWTSNGGMINQSGVFTAQTAVATGKLITATHDTISQTALVNIVARPLNSIVITPSTASIVAGSAFTFTAAGFDVYSNSVPITPTWSTDGGMINQGGVFTAQAAVATGKLNHGHARYHLSDCPRQHRREAAQLNRDHTEHGVDRRRVGLHLHRRGVRCLQQQCAHHAYLDNERWHNQSKRRLYRTDSTAATGKLVTATQGVVSRTALVNIMAGPLHAIVITPSTASIVVGTAFTFTAAGFDVYSNSVPITPTWTTNGGTISQSGVFTAQNTVATGKLVTATQGIISETSLVNTVAAPLYAIVITPSTASIVAGSVFTFTTAGFDVYSNSVPITPAWTTNGGTISQSGVFTAQNTVATGRLITAAQGAISKTALVNIIAAPLNRIAVSPSAVTMTVGTTRTFTANGFDRYNNSVPITPTWTTNGGTISQSGVFTAQNMVTVGKLVTATQGVISGTALVNLAPGNPYTLTLQPPTAVISAGTKITYTASALDVYGNSIGNITAGTTFSIASGAGGSFAGNAVTPTVRNTWIVTGTIGTVSSTATLTVTAAAFNRLAIEAAPAGSGLAVNNVTLTVYDTLPVYAAAYDVYSNLIGPRTVTWGGTGVVTGNLSPTIGLSTTFTPVISGTGTITAISSGITDTTGLITVQAPVLRISKSANPSPATPGTQIEYTIVFTNAGNAAAQNVVITETYPLSTSYLFASIPPSSGDNLWSIGSVGAGVSGTLVVYVSVPSQMPVGSVLTNSVQLGAAKVNSATFTIATTVNAVPDLTATVVDNPDPVRPGDFLNYFIIYRNSGSAPVTNVRLTETYPSGVSFVSANPPPNVDNNVWLTSTLAGENQQINTIAVTVRVNRPLSDSTILNNRVTIAADQAPPYLAAEQTLVTAPEVQLTKVADPLTPTANGPLTYTLHYTNSGSSYAANTIITDALPINTSFGQCQPIGCTVNNGIVTWNLGQVAAQSADVVTLTVHVANNLSAGTRITNTARLTSADLISAITIVTSTIASAPDLVVTNTNGVTALAAGEVTTYVLGYANLGTAPTQNVVITDRIPDNTAFVDCTACTPSGGGVYSFTLGTVNAAQSSAVTVSVRVASILPAGLRFITNTAHIATTTDGDASANNTADDVDAIVTQPALDLSVDYDASTPYPGKVITYTLRYTNSSAMDTTNVVISTTRLPYVNVVPTGWSFSGGDDLYSVGNLAAGQAGTINYVVVLTATFTPDMNAFANNFLIHDGGPGGLPAASQNVTTTVGVPDLIIESVKVPGTIARNQQFTATLTIRNIGLGRACNPNLPGCGQTWVDAFVDPVTPPSSYPFSGYGDPFARTPQIDPGLTATVYITNIQFGANQDFFLYFKVDNFDCHGSTCLPPGSLGGLVPESNEYNNLTGPIHLSSFTVYLPLVTKSKP